MIIGVLLCILAVYPGSLIVLIYMILSGTSPDTMVGILAYGCTLYQTIAFMTLVRSDLSLKKKEQSRTQEQLIPMTAIQFT